MKIPQAVHPLTLTATLLVTGPLAHQSQAGEQRGGINGLEALVARHCTTGTSLFGSLRCGFGMNSLGAAAETKRARDDKSNDARCKATPPITALPPPQGRHPFALTLGQ